MDTEVLDRAVEAVMDVLDEQVEQGLAINHCILGTRVFIEVARYAGLDARPVPVGAVAMNRAAEPYILARTPIEEWPDEAWSVGVYRGNGMEGPGHLVAVVDGNILVETTARQFDRPQHGVNVPHGPLVLPLNEEWSLQDSLLVQFTDRGPGGDDWDSALLYWPDKPHREYHRASDWRSKYKPLAADAIRRYRAG